MKQCQSDRLKLDEQERAQILALATDFPRLWQDPYTPDRERKRMARLILEDVTLLGGTQITAHIRFKGGATRTLVLPLPLSAAQLRKTKPDIVEEVDRLLDHHTDEEVAIILNQRGLRSGCGKPFNHMIVTHIRRNYGLANRFTRLREHGMLNIEEMAKTLGVCTDTVKRWRQHGLLQGHRYNDKGQCLFEPPGENKPVKGNWKCNRQAGRKMLSNVTHEV